MRPIMRKSLASAAVLSLLAMTACSQTDPLTKPYAWHPTNVNANNIATMAVNPADLIKGRHTERRRAIGEAEGAERVWTNKPTPFVGGGGGAAAGGGT